MGQPDTPAFVAFWQRYPRKRDGKSEARKAHAKALTTATAEEIMDGLESYQFSDNPQFWPMAATWLHKERWTHEPDTAPPTLICPKPQTDLARLSESLFEDTPTINEKGMPI